MTAVFTIQWNQYNILVWAFVFFVVPFFVFFVMLCSSFVIFVNL